LRSRASLSPDSRSRHNRGVAFNCVKCWAIVDEYPSEGPVLCVKCRELAKADEERKERQARVAGRQPLVCERCSEPFLASRISQRFCSARCRTAAWRSEHRVAI
jgi:hypothetical protein